MKLLFTALAVLFVTTIQGAHIPRVNIFEDETTRGMMLENARELFESMKLSRVEEKITPCKGHDQFEGSYVAQAAKSKALVIGQSYSYDAINKRTRAITSINVSGKSYLYNTVMLYNKKMMFIVDMNTHKCTNRTIDFPWEPADIPADATYAGSAYLGASNIPDQGLLLDFYFGKKDQGDYWSAVTREGCWMSFGAVNRADIGYVQSTLFNLKEGIKDPSVFDIPKECQTKAEEEF